MVSALDSGSGGLGSNPGRGTALCSSARYNFDTIYCWGNPAMD